MKVLLGPLARSGLERRAGANLPSAINQALVYYVGKLESGRRPSCIPTFLDVPRRQAESGPGTEAPLPRVEVEVTVDARVEAALAADAERQGASLPEVTGHAVLVYLAEFRPARPARAARRGSRG